MARSVKQNKQELRFGYKKTPPKNNLPSKALNLSRFRILVALPVSFPLSIYFFCPLLHHWHLLCRACVRGEAGKRSRGFILQCEISLKCSLSLSLPSPSLPFSPPLSLSLSESLLGSWSARGCRALTLDSGRTRCACDALSTFAILARPNPESVSPLCACACIAWEMCLLLCVRVCVTVRVCVCAWRCCLLKWKRRIEQVVGF